MTLKQAAPPKHVEAPSTKATHQNVQDTIGIGGGLGFMAGMFLPVGLMHLGVDFHLESMPISLALAIFVGSPFVGWGLLWWLNGLGVKHLGRPAMAYLNTAMLLTILAALGWVAGCVFAGGNVVIAALLALGLIMPNAVLFYSRREYLYGEGD